MITSQYLFQFTDSQSLIIQLDYFLCRPPLLLFWKQNNYNLAMTQNLNTYLNCKLISCTKNDLKSFIQSFK